MRSWPFIWITQAFRSFARLDMGEYPSDSTLQANITAIDAETWEAVNRVLLGFTAQRQVEQGRTVRVDAHRGGNPYPSSH